MSQSRSQQDHSSSEKPKVPTGTAKLLEDLRNKLIEAQEIIVHQEGTITRLSAPPFKFGIVISINRRPEANSLHRGARVRVLNGPYQARLGKVQGFYKDAIGVTFRDGHAEYFDPSQLKAIDLPIEKSSTVTVLVEGTLLDLMLPLDLQLSPGSIVRIGPALQIIDTGHQLPRSGELATVIEALGERVEVNFQGESRIVLSNGKQLELGSRVILDSSGTIILEDLGLPNHALSYIPSEKILWDDIGGQNEAKTHLREVVELPFTRPKLLAYYRGKISQEGTSGCVLYGPPGCGKTLLGKAAATAVSSYHKGEPGFFFVSGPELKNLYYGNTESSIRLLFYQAQRFYEKYGYPAVIFFDEADSLFPSRTGILRSADNSAVGQMLSMLNGKEYTGAFVIFATNRLDLIDPALIRDVRFNRWIRVDRPDQDTTEAIFKIHLAGIPLCNGHKLDHVAYAAADALFGNRLTFYHLSLDNGKQIPFRLSDMVSGALVKGIVDRSVSLAIQRDLKKNTQSGISLDDLNQAVSESFREKKDINHDPVLAEIEERLQAKIIEIGQYRRTGNGSN